MGYKISLLNYIFDRDNNNAILFDTAEKLRRFFDDKILYVMEDVNFISSDLISASVYFDNNEAQPLLKLLNYNYAIVEAEDEEPMYFWILSSKQDSGSNIRLELSIDAWNTYINKVKTAYGLIKRAHLSRFTKINDKYVYNFRKDSALFEREDLQNLSKLPTKLTRLKQSFNNNEELETWIYNNVDHWIYYYLSPGEYQFDGKTITLESIQFQESTIPVGFDRQAGGFVVLCAPIYKANSSWIYLKDSHVWSANSIREFLNENNGTANVFAIKHSLLCPLYLISYYSNFEYEILEGGQLLIKNHIDDDDPLTRIKSNLFTYFDSAQNSVVQVLYQPYGLEAKFTCPEELGNWEFDKDQINATTEPKIENEDYCNYRLFLGGQEYLMPVSKTSTIPTFKYVEILEPDITKAILIFDPDSSIFGADSVMTQATKKDFTGFTITLDLSQWIVQDNLDLYLANNKNALQIFGNEQNARRADFATKTVIGGVATAGASAGMVAKGNPIASGITSITGAVSTIANAVNFEYQQQIREDNFNLTLDNMRASPDTIKKLNSNAFLIASVSRIAIYIEREDCIEFEKEKVIDYLKMFGYSYSRSGNMLDFLKNRHYYNYIQGIIDEIDVEASEIIKDRLRNIFYNGVRVWRGENFTNVDYNLNNIEEEIYNG